MKTEYISRFSTTEFKQADTIEEAMKLCPWATLGVEDRDKEGFFVFNIETKEEFIEWLMSDEAIARGVLRGADLPYEVEVGNEL